MRERVSKTNKTFTLSEHVWQCAVLVFMEGEVLRGRQWGRGGGVSFEVSPLTLHGIAVWENSNRV